MGKFTIKNNSQLDMTNCHVSMTSLPIFVHNKTIFCSGPSFGLIELKFGAKVIFNADGKF